MSKWCRCLLVGFAAFVGATAGCAETGPQMSLKSPSDLIRDAAFGKTGFTNTEYGGSTHARDWAMQKEAMERQQQFQQFANSAPGQTRL